MGVETGEWLELLRTDYLDGYVREGGAAVKFAVVRDRAACALATCATKQQYPDLLTFIQDDSLGESRIYFLRPINPRHDYLFDRGRVTQTKLQTRIARALVTAVSVAATHLRRLTCAFNPRSSANRIAFAVGRDQPQTHP